MASKALALMHNPESELRGHAALEHFDAETGAHRVFTAQLQRGREVEVSRVEHEGQRLSGRDRLLERLLRDTVAHCLLSGPLWSATVGAGLPMLLLAGSAALTAMHATVIFNRLQDVKRGARQ